MKSRAALRGDGSPDARGRDRDGHDGREIVELAQGPLDATLFAAPPDYKRMDMSNMMMTVPARTLDSAMYAGAASATTAICDSRGAR
jgi:hypothetical protein